MYDQRSKAKLETWNVPSTECYGEKYQGCITKNAIFEIDSEQFRTNFEIKVFTLVLLSEEYFLILMTENNSKPFFLA